MYLTVSSVKSAIEKSGCEQYSFSKAFQMSWAYRIQCMDVYNVYIRRKHTITSYNKVRNKHAIKKCKLISLILKVVYDNGLMK